MSKRVRYNGGTECYYNCTRPTKLVVGKEYEVARSRDLGWQTVYTLKGLNGEFNSLWFDDVHPKSKVYMAISYEHPVIGERYCCYKLELNTGVPEFVGWSTSPVKEIHYMGDSIYKIITHNSVYIVDVC